MRKDGLRHAIEHLMYYDHRNHWERRGSKFIINGRIEIDEATKKIFICEIGSYFQVTQGQSKSYILKKLSPYLGRRKRKVEPGRNQTSLLI